MEEGILSPSTSYAVTGATKLRAEKQSVREVQQAVTGRETGNKGTFR